MSYADRILGGETIPLIEISEEHEAEVKAAYMKKLMRDFEVYADEHKLYCPLSLKSGFPLAGQYDRIIVTLIGTFVELSEPCILPDIVKYDGLYKIAGRTDLDEFELYRPLVYRDQPDSWMEVDVYKCVDTTRLGDFLPNHYYVNTLDIKDSSEFNEDLDLF